MSTKPMLEVRGISKRYGGVQALDDVSVTFDAGQVHCLAGVNGSGKSTLIKIISGVEQADSGSIMLRGAELVNNSPRNAMHHGIQVIYQDMALIPNLTVAENIVMLRRSLSNSPLVTPTADKEHAREVVSRLGVELDLDAFVEDLPIADRQLVAIARALAQDASVLFMDEPTTALTWREVDQLFVVVNRLRSDGVAVVFVSHKLDEVLSISDQVTVLRNGVLVAEGPSSSFSHDSLAEALVGEKTATDRVIIEPQPADTPVLRVQELRSERLFKGITFDVAPGEIVGLTGLRGSGRSEIAEALFGLLPIDGGIVEVDGQRVPHGDPIKAIESGIAYVPADRLTQGVFLDQSINDNLISASLPAVTSKIGVLGRAPVRALVSRGLSSMRVKYGKESDAIRTLSGGNQQKVVLAKWAETKPRVLILNGPTVGVDIGSKFAILDILRGYAREGMGIVIVSDDFQEVVSVCNRVLVVDKGLITHQISGAEMTEEHVRELVSEEAQHEDN
ncbi:sugar ABC transporter ATP-binding protein [Tessaracoccus defluvii]|uniref:Sugar ABC transporter ATP-binding protein n=1 Tax=Tessaracoccus defluvii TaxID=1285901 RepID=A0A7H0H481_9ACTN|nr:sugar ABC transporter ATP-binding protein [Tessaracoccus defluvii]QNP55347.1 sugar ABC transporter ATP-binding protein [Tessaracoccus defluvii]